MDNLSNTEISEVMSLAKHTVKVHKYNLYKKLNLTKMSRAEAHKQLVKFGEDNKDLFLDLFAPEVEDVSQDTLAPV
jgi:hypothetical protein